MSRIGRKPITLPQSIKLEVKDSEVFVSGKTGVLKRKILEGISVEVDGNVVYVKRANDDKKTKGYHGLMRTLIMNMVEGIDKGFEKNLKSLELGIGLRCREMT